ncbi:unnamed protein product [Effrenium voratum]|nr:unnamed protein product [Effrenium voratum]
MSALRWPGEELGALCRVRRCFGTRRRSASVRRCFGGRRRSASVRRCFGGRRRPEALRGAAAQCLRGPGPAKAPKSIQQEVEHEMRGLKERRSPTTPSRGGKETPDWERVAYRFRIDQGRSQPGEAKAKAPYSDHSGLRFPSLETAENYDYHMDRGLSRLVERAYPIKVPGHRRLDPFFREYLFFLHDLDPARFTVQRIAQRYRLREKTVAKVLKEWGTNRYLTRSGLTKLHMKQQTREAEVLSEKERAYAKWVGWDQMGDQDDPESDDEALGGEFKGWRSTSDWVRRQKIEVEMMSAFPMMEKRDPMPKRVDVDMVADTRRAEGWTMRADVLVASF